MHSVAESHKNSHNRESLRQHNSKGALKSVASPKQSPLQHSWGNNLLRPLPFTFCSPRHGPKTPQNSRLILLPSEEAEKTWWRVWWRLCVTSLRHYTVQILICYSLNWPISNGGRTINQTMKRKINSGFKIVFSRGSHPVKVWQSGSVAWSYGFSSVIAVIALSEDHVKVETNNVWINDDHQPRLFSQCWQKKCPIGKDNPV